MIHIRVNPSYLWDVLAWKDPLEGGKYDPDQETLDKIRRSLSRTFDKTISKNDLREETVYGVLAQFHQSLLKELSENGSRILEWIRVDTEATAREDYHIPDFAISDEQAGNFFGVHNVFAHGNNTQQIALFFPTLPYLSGSMAAFSRNIRYP